jgi:hypothetical protein
METKRTEIIAFTLNEIYVKNNENNQNRATYGNQ